MYLKELRIACKYMFFMSIVINFASLVESVLFINTFVVVPSVVGVPTLSGYSMFWLATVILTLCLFALFGLMSQTKPGKEIFLPLGTSKIGMKMKVLVPLVVF